ncbi:MAG: HAMP domain-containing histidine kinase [Burkholderiales bacterium]|nr:HAMP domain-containing histidine kinase [Nitrosomonas sp.]MCP5276078.1 HAMP domain-containing histidine kinase [Burkholderiales bacterium]
MNYYIESGDSVKKRYPKSFLKLILFGFALIGAPLIGTLIYISVVIDNLAERSRETIYQATEITHGNRVLADEALAMERSLRQALILKDLTLLEGYLHSHKEFNKTIKNFNDLFPNTEYQRLLRKIRLSELVIFEQILNSTNFDENLQTQIENFSVLLNTIQDLKNSGNILIGQYVNEMFERANQVRTTIELLLLAVIPFVIVLAIFLSILITRPIKQIDEAIYNLGQGELNSSIYVTGPQNLRQLGERLDWLRRRLLKLEKQKNQFLRHISHELKTPLTAIREGADLLAEGVTGNLSKKQQSIANILHSSSLQLQKRIEDLLSYSAIQFTETMLVKRSVSLSRILDNTLQNQNLSIVNKKLKIICNRSDILYKCDEKKMQTIFDNLLSNAIKFSPVCSSIEINFSQDSKSVIIDFKDSGCGIHDEDKDKIFDPFFQGQLVPDAHVKGTGLGLSIAQEFALVHGGRIFLINHENLGTHFRLILPRQTNE